MNKLFFIFTFLIFISNASATEINVQSKVENVVIYHSGALVQRSVSANIQQGNNELIFKNVSSKVVLNSIKIANKNITILNKSIIRKLSQEEFKQLEDRKEVLTNQLSLIESKFKEVGFITKVEDLEKMTAFYSKNIMSTKRELREVVRRIEEAKELENIELKNKDAAILKLIVSSNTPFIKSFDLQYVCGGIGWSPAYEIEVKDASADKLELKYLARVMSQTGEDWDNIQIQFSSSFPLESPTNLPQPSSPWVLNENERFVDNRYDMDKPMMDYEIIEDDDASIQGLSGVSYKRINVPQFLELRTLEGKYSIKSNSTIFTFPINENLIPAHFLYYGYPCLDPNSYLVVELTDWDSFGYVDGMANISFHGNDVGSTLINFSTSVDTLVLPIGKDNGIYMNRSEIANQKYFKTRTNGKKKEITMAYQFELKNKNDFPITIELNEQIPISQSKSAEVEMINISGGKLNNEIGEITWILELMPGETVKKELIFTIDMNGDFSIAGRSKSKRYRAVNSPQF